MNGYLVLVRGNLDDVPVRFFHAREWAEAFAKQKGIEAIAHDVAREVLGVDTPSQVNYVDVVRFQDGIPTDYRIRVVDFDQLPAETA